MILDNKKFEVNVKGFSVTTEIYRPTRLDFTGTIFLENTKENSEYIANFPSIFELELSRKIDLNTLTLDQLETYIKVKKGE